MFEEPVKRPGELERTRDCPYRAHRLDRSCDCRSTADDSDANGGSGCQRGAGIGTGPMPCRVRPTSGCLPHKAGGIDET